MDILACADPWVGSVCGDPVSALAGVTPQSTRQRSVFMATVRMPLTAVIVLSGSASVLGAVRVECESKSAKAIPVVSRLADRSARMTRRCRWQSNRICSQSADGIQGGRRTQAMSAAAACRGRDRVCDTRTTRLLYCSRLVSRRREVGELVGRGRISRARVRLVSAGKSGRQDPHVTFAHDCQRLMTNTRTLWRHLQSCSWSVV